ncbi:MAG: class I SAM-dependent methyltransferase, partial [Planctomycetia bacterium]
MNQPSTSKAFDAIRAEYAFFETHADEATADVAGYAAKFVETRRAAADRVVSILDFGCGDGRFSSLLHDHVALPPERLKLTLVEPDDEYRIKAVEALRRFTAHPTSAFADLAAAVPPRAATSAANPAASSSAGFDVVLTNHALYYVPDLAGTVAALVGSLAPGGVFLAAIAGDENLLVQIWREGFRRLEIPLPFHVGEDLAGVLTRLGAGFERKFVPYTLRFPDTTANR